MFARESLSRNMSAGPWFGTQRVQTNERKKNPFEFLSGHNEQNSAV